MQTGKTCKALEHLCLSLPASTFELDKLAYSFAFSVRFSPAWTLDALEVSQGCHTCLCYLWSSPCAVRYNVRKSHGNKAQIRLTYLNDYGLRWFAV